MSRFTIDHVTIAASRLEAIAGAFSSAGLEAEYGGQHSNGATHMSLLGFDDGSYIELVSVVRPGLEAPWWHPHIVRDMGPCAWAVRVDGVDAECARLRSAGVAVDGPHAMHRRRPDGETAEWSLAFVGEGEAGAMHPFIIADHTDRALRSVASSSVSGSELVGIGCVVLGVPDEGRAAADLAAAYGLVVEHQGHESGLDARLTRFDDPVVVLASPSAGDDWMAERVELLGASPCAFLIRSEDLALSRDRLSLGAPEPWGSESVCWFEGGAMAPLRLGVVGA
jgi:hypothetical protein